MTAPSDPVRARRRAGRIIDVAGALCVGIVLVAYPLAALLAACGALLWFALRVEQERETAAQSRP